MKMLSVAGALLLAVPAVASARGGGAGGRSGGGFGAPDGHSEARHAHVGHRGSFDDDSDDDFFSDYDHGPDFYASSGECGYHSGRWHETGRSYWLRRYESCMRG